MDGWIDGQMDGRCGLVHHGDTQVDGRATTRDGEKMFACVV